MKNTIVAAQIALGTCGVGAMPLSMPWRTSSGPASVQTASSATSNMPVRSQPR